MVRNRYLYRLGPSTFVLFAAGALQACSAPAPVLPETATRDAAEPAVSPGPAAPRASAPTVVTPAASPPADPTPTAPSASPAPKPSQLTATSPDTRPPPADAQNPGAQPSIAIYMLSRGSGVPDSTRETYRKIRSLLEQQQRQSVVTDITSKRIGLEGETRLCARFTDRAQADATVTQIHKLSADVALLNVVEEPYPPSKEAPP